MHQFIYVFISVLSFYVQDVYLSASNASRFQFNEEARTALCPFVGNEGLRCFDEDSLRNPRGLFSLDYLKLPHSVEIIVDRSNGQLKAPAIELTYIPTGTSLWTDGFADAIFDMFNEAILTPANRVTTAYDIAQVCIFQNTLELDAVWQETYGNGKISDEELARPLDMLEYFNK